MITGYHDGSAASSPLLDFGERTLSWAPQVITDSGQWTGNHLLFATKEEAEMFLAEFCLLRNHGLWKHPIRSTTAGRTDGSCASDVPADGYGMVAVGGCSMRLRTPDFHLCSRSRAYAADHPHQPQGAVRWRWVA